MANKGQSAGKEKPTDQEKTMKTYILRCWREGNVNIIGDSEWRFSLEPLGGAEKRQGFVSLLRLFRFLAHKIGVDDLSDSDRKDIE